MKRRRGARLKRTKSVLDIKKAVMYGLFEDGDILVYKQKRCRINKDGWVELELPMSIKFQYISTWCSCFNKSKKGCLDKIVLVRTLENLREINIKYRKYLERE